MAIEYTETTAGRSGKGAGSIVRPESLEFAVEREDAHVVRKDFFNQQIHGGSGEIRHVPGSHIPGTVFLMLNVSGNRKDIAGGPIIGTRRVIAGTRFIVQQIPLQA